MANLSIKSIFPASGVQGVPLGVNPTVTLDGIDFDFDSLEESFFLEGPDTDQFIGPGQISLINNISQGDVDNFLQSPGYQGLVPGTVTASGYAAADETILTFEPTDALSPLVQYTMNLTEVLDPDGNTISGYFTSTFTTGSGAIIAIPEETSNTILSQTASDSSSLTTTAFEVENVTPADHSIENPLTTSEIVVTFNKKISSSSLDGRVSVSAAPATDHPNAAVQPERDLAFSTTVEGKQLKIKI